MEEVDSCDGQFCFIMGAGLFAKADVVQEICTGRVLEKMCAEARVDNAMAI